MKNKVKSIGLISVIFLLMISITNAQLAFDHDDAPIQLDLFNLFTIAGRERGCSDEPIRSGIERLGFKSFPQGFCSDNNNELINFYIIRSSGWDFQRESSTPTSFSYGTTWAWECYSCPTLGSECTSGEKRCLSSVQVESCVFGQWAGLIKCSGTKECSRGECVDTDPGCNENWDCNTWSICVNNQKYRTCVDKNSCGSLSDKPITVESCTTPTVCGNGICEPPETEISCPGDCPAEPPIICGDGKCESPETAIICPTDCAITPPPDKGLSGIQIGIIISGFLVILGGVWFFFFKR